MSIASEMDKDIRQYSEQVKSDCEKIAREVQADMLAMIPSRTPVGKGDRNGHLRDGWVKGDIRLKSGAGTLYGVRSKNKPSIVHLVNFPHRIVTMARGNNEQGTATFRHVGTALYRTAAAGMTHGDPFVDEVQDEGVQELDERLTRYFNGTE